MPYKDRDKQLAAQTRHYHDNKQTFIDRNGARRDARKEWLEILCSNLHCIHCTEAAPECFDFHHVDPATKIDSVSNLVNTLRSMDMICTEIEKCVVLCSNCHRKYHKGTITLDKLTEQKVKIPAELRNTALFARPISSLFDAPLPPKGLLSMFLEQEKQSPKGLLPMILEQSKK